MSKPQQLGRRNRDAQYRFHAIIEKEGEEYCALCLELDIATESGTLEGAKRNLRDAVAGYIESVVRDGEEEEFIPRPVPEDVKREYESKFKAYLTSFDPAELYGYHETINAAPLTPHNITATC